MAVKREDTARLDAPKRTPQGGIVAPAFLTRSGIFVYHRADGSQVKEYRPAEEVFHADSLASLAAAPVTQLHPDAMVRPSNFRKFAVGHVGENVRKDGDMVAATLYVQDAEAVKAVESGMRQVSCGYSCDIDETPGEANGQRYDRVQRNIRYNHCALVPVGRAGAEVALRLDATDNQSSKVESMKVERIDGVEYEIGSEQHKAAIASRDEIAKLKTERDQQQARADVADGEAKRLANEAIALKDPKRFDAAVAERATLIETARRIAGAEFKADGLTAEQIRAAALAKGKPDLKLEGKSVDYVAAAFDLAAEAAPQTRADEVARAAAGLSVTSDRIDVVDARAAMLERNRNAWKGTHADEGKE